MLDWLLILNRRHLASVLRVYVDHYNRERPHRALEHRAPESDDRRERSPAGENHHRDRLGVKGVITRVPVSRTGSVFARIIACSEMGWLLDQRCGSVPSVAGSRQEQGIARGSWL